MTDRNRLRRRRGPFITVPILAATLGFGSLWIGSDDGQIARLPIAALGN